MTLDFEIVKVTVYEVMVHLLTKILYQVRLEKTLKKYLFKSATYLAKMV
jgi:hypothetical protein